MNDYDAIVIGSGAGGLTAALAMARAGKRVIVFEQHYLPGGWCHSFNLDGYRFSPGVHYIGAMEQGGVMRSILQGLGVADDLVWLELNPDGYDHIRIGDEQFDIPSGKERYKDRLKQRFPSEAKGIDGFIDACDRMQTELQSGVRIGSLKDAITVPWRLRDVIRFGLTPIDRFLDRFTKDPMLRAILTMQAGDHGMPPSTAPTALHASVIGHYLEGGYYPMGGGRSIPKAFIKQLRKHGGQLKVRTGVDKVLLEDGRAVGVRLADGTEVTAPIVVSNADPHVTYGRLVGREHLPSRVRRRLDRTTYSISSLSLFFAVKGDMAARGLDSGNVWYGRTPSIEAFYDLAVRPDLTGLKELPGAFLTTTTLKDRTKRRDGVHTMESFVFVSWESFQRWAHTEYGERPGDYERMKADLTDMMLDTIEEIVPGIKQDVVYTSLGTPLTNKHYCASTRGNLYGIEKRAMQVGPFSYGVQTPIEGLLMCGASTLGHGVLGACVSGLAAAKQALKCRRSELLTGSGTITMLPADHPERWPEPWRSKAGLEAEGVAA